MAAAARAGVEQDSNRTERASKAFSLIVRGCLATTILTFQNMAAHKKNSTNHDSHILENIGQLQRRRIHQHLFTLLPIIKVNPVILFL